MKRVDTLHSLRGVAATLFTGLLGATAVAQANVIYSDDQMSSANWSVVRSIGGPGGSISVFDQGSGGNPGANRHVEHVHASSSTSNPSQLWSFHFRSGATFDPILAGQIDRVEFRMDTRLFAVLGLDGFAIGPAVLQGGRVYAARIGNTPEPIWTTKFRSGLTESSFQLWDVARANWGVGSPDFSNTAAPLQFGFLSGTTHTTLGAQSRRVGVDNWRIEIYRSCVPGTFTTIAPGCGGNGIPAIAPSLGQVPRAGQPFRVAISGFPLTTPQGGVLMLAGVRRISPPIDLTFLGMTGCQLAMDPIYLEPCRTVLGTGFWEVQLLAPVGYVLYLQSAVFDPLANPAGLALSNTAKLVVGP